MATKLNTSSPSSSSPSSPSSGTGTVKRRPMSAPKTSEVAAIPRIVLDDPTNGEAPNDVTSTSVPTGGGVVNGPRMGVRPVSGVEFGGSGGGGGFRDGDLDQPQEYVPHRCNSDIGLPTTSMPNLSLHMSLGSGGAGEGAAGDKLGVYCSPRTTRRSVDLDVGPRDGAARQDYSDWLEERTSSLRVLSAGSRVGSAVSLTSVCTAHSVGLLSNDSDDDFQDASLHDGASSISGSGICLGPVGTSASPSASASERAGQLRRLQSYPEEQQDKDGSAVSPRTSYSLCNLKAAQAPSTERPDDPNKGQPRGQLTPDKLCLLPSDLDETEDNRVLPPGEDGHHGGRGGKGGSGGGHHHTREGGEEGKGKSHIVSYSSGNNAMREGRIRRWLQDMDKASD